MERQEIIDRAQREMFDLLDRFCAKLVKAGMTREELREVLTTTPDMVDDTISEACGD